MNKPSRDWSMVVFTAIVVAGFVALAALSACTEITTYYPVCEITHADGSVDTMAVPDSACIAGFLGATR